MSSNNVSQLSLAGDSHVHIGSTSHSHPDDDETRRCLADLRITDPRNDKSRIEASKGGLLKDASHWIIDHVDFQQWYHDDGNRVLWIEGGPGQGKTMLLIGIIDELELRLTDRDVLSYFFCQFNDTRTNSTTAVLRGLIYLLVLQQPSLVSYILERYRHADRNLFEDANAFIALSKILQRMLRGSQLSDVYFVIDALDECTGDLPQLLDLIVNISSESSSRVKWIVSSRPWEGLKVHRLRLSDTLIKLELGLINSYDQFHAFEVYVGHMVAKLGQLQQHEGLQLEVQQMISQRGEKSFLWVSLIIQQLQQLSRPEQILKALDEMPATLTALYDRAIRSIEDENMISTVRIVISTVITARRPLHLLELRILTNLQEVQDKNNLENIVKMCGSFLTIRDGRLSFIHQSGVDYLMNSVIFPHGPLNGHYRIFSLSLSALSRTLRQDICNLRHPGALINDTQPADQGPLTPLDYSCQYWANHLLESDFCDLGSMHDLSDEGTVFAFLKKHFLHWLEYSSFIHSSYQTTVNIRSLLQYLEPRQSESPHLIRFLTDAERFALSHGSIIRQAPLQTYASALVFSPANSEVKTQFWNERLQDVISIRGMPENWGTCQQALEGHSGSVWAVAFSPDGHFLASGSNDKTLRVWDTRTGASLGFQEGKGTVRAVAISSDNSTIAWASYDGIIRIWDYVLEQPPQDLSGHTDWVTSVSFSPNGLRLASASKDKTIRLWDATSGECLKILYGHSKWLSSVAFDPDGQQLVSSSHDRTIRLWNANTGVCQRKIGGFDTIINSVAFSPDCRQIVSASDESIRIWDTNTGVCLRVLEGHSNWVNSVSFSPDGRRLASASKDKTIRLWDAATGACLQILNGHSSSVSSVSFSPNGEQLASGSNDWSVRFWDTSMESNNQTAKGHSGSIRALALSSNDQWLASASIDNTVRLWNTKIGSCQQTLIGHAGSVTNIAFSPDGLRLASASKDKTIRLWNTLTGEHILTLEGHGGSVRDVAFSFDGLQLVSSSEDSTIRLWDATTVKCKRVIKVDMVHTKLAFTSDDRYLQTNKGLLFVATDSPFIVPFQPRSSGRIHVKKSWVSRDGENLIWLPRDYRAVSWISHDNLLVLGHESGQVTFLELNLSKKR